jgi:DNA-binding transcriptional ArsR family regulator
MSHTIPAADNGRTAKDREWLGQVWERLPFTANGITYTTIEEVLEDFYTPEQAADIEWYREALEEYERQRDYWEAEFEKDPPTEAEKELAQELYAAGYLDEINLECPLHPSATGSRDYEVKPTLPPGWLIRDAVAARSAHLFGDDQSAETAGCSLSVGKVQGGGKITHLFYDGVMNSVFGDRSAGKTWLALALAREFIERGEHVVWLNFEAMLGSTLRERLAAMGVELAKIAAYFHVYDRPDEAPATTMNVHLVVIDAVDPCLSHMGRNTLNDGAAVDEMAKRYFYPYQQVTPAVVGLTIDHIGNSNDKRESGSRRKQHYTQGVKYQMDSRVKSRKGTKGYSALMLRKDNNGEIPFEDGEDVAYVVLDSTRDADAIDVLITASEPLKANESVTEQTQRKSARTEILRIVREAGGVIDREEFNAKMKAAGYTLGNVRTQLSKLKDASLIAAEDDVISMIAAD